MCDCKETKTRYRSDQILFTVVDTLDGGKLYVSVQEDDEATMVKQVKKIVKKIKKEKPVSAAHFAENYFSETRGAK